LRATAPKGLTLAIDEVDTVGQPLSRSWPGHRYTSLSATRAAYDLIVVHVPPPASGANHLRNRYKNLAAVSTRAGRVDVGRLGPRKWTKRVWRLHLEVLPKLKSDADLVLVLPMATRVAPLVDGYPYWSYEPSPCLLDGVDAMLGTSGLGTVFDLVVVDKNPVAQPFFCERRCPWRVIGLNRSLDRQAVPEYVDELFASLEDDLV
jgi:hypothetical protein